ncbi:putative PH and SEC7 domain-containing protein 4-like [Scophthalmus maximus]|uniref:Putative PH and SEC7 domain-containing protein 4-like n=1 Tax=Scophthalmus maximus TaxID=52904 RepID=A0A2U9CHU4_SCOMX|nr:putative PH and SEC7 domain-containing protein 4-like [Scophthalmus maximus]
MEEEILCSSLLHSTDSVLQQPEQDSWTCIDHQYINGEQEAFVLDETEVEINPEHGTDDLNLSPDTGRETPEEAEQWEQIIWPVRPMTCASATLSFATVQWDMPGPFAEKPSLVTDRSLANELYSGGVTSLDAAPPALRQPEDDGSELVMKEEREEPDGFDSQLPNSNVEGIGNGYEPCDAADVPEPTTQEEEGSTHELPDSIHVNLILSCKNIPEIALGTESEQDDGHSDVTSAPVETVYLIDTIDESESSEDEAELEEEQEGPGVLLTGQGHSEERQNSANSGETEEVHEEGGEEEEEEQSVTDAFYAEDSEEAKTLSCLSDVEVSAEPLQTDDTGPTLNQDKLIDLLRSELVEESWDSATEEILEPSHEDPTVWTEEPEMCEDVDHDVEPEQPEAVDDDDEEATIQEAENADGLVQSESSDESEVREQLSAETELTQQTAEAEFEQVAAVDETSHQDEEPRGSEDGNVHTVMATGEQRQRPETAVPHLNGGEVDREMASRLAEQLFKLDGIQRVDVVKHLDKDNDFSHAVGEEYLKLFDFTGQTLDQALRSFLRVVVLIGESQERERVLQHFAYRFHQCNPDAFSSSGATLALTCALMLLNTDLHGQHAGKSMSSSKFVSNLDGMSEGENFSKDLLKSLYNSIKSEPLEWAIDEEELKSSVLPEEDSGDTAPLHLKANPFQDVPHDKKAPVVKEGFLQRKLHADIDGKRTPWGKRGWKTFYGVLRGMVLYLQKDDYRRDQPTYEEVVSVHHSVAEQAADYTKKPHVFRLQTADWRVFLFQASSKVEMNSWISRLNLVSALHSSPPFPAAVGSQRKFFRPILPASHSAHTLERQLQSHTGMLESFKADLSYLQQNPPEGRKARAKELEEHRVRAEYLQHEICRFETYIQVLEGWKKVEKTGNGVSSAAELSLFDKKAVCANSVREEAEDDGGLKKSHSSPSLELEIAPPTVIKVRRNISERRTYRRTIVPRWNKDA